MERLSGVLMWVLATTSLLVAAAPSYSNVSPLVPCNGTRKFDLTLTWETYAPDGREREMILVNGQYPGPLLEIDQGDEVEVDVFNLLPFNTTIHFHGIEMHLTPWSDGVPGVTQKQIPTGSSFKHKWTATQYGSYWYHAHERGQLDDGLLGPILIHPRKDSVTPFSLISSDTKTLAAIAKAEASKKPLVLSDFRHVTSADGWDIEIASGIETPCYDSILFNGKGSVDCWPAEKIASLLSPAQESFLQLANETSFTAKACFPPSVFAVLAGGLPTNLSTIPPEIFDVCVPSKGDQEVISVYQKSCESQKWLALDVIGTFGLFTGSFSIDEHPMYVYAVDGDFIEPQLVEAITITNGDRYSVLVNLTTPGDYAIRMASTAAAQMLAANATLSYRAENVAPLDRASIPYIDEVGVNTTADVVFFSEAVMKAYPPAPVAQTADQTFKLHMRVAGQSYNWALNSTVYAPELDNDYPVLFRPDPAEMSNVTISTLNDTWVDLIFVTDTFPMPPHPIHKHGNKMWKIGSGNGPFNWTTVAEAVQAVPQNFNLVDPPLRDTIATPAATTGPAWMVVRYHVANPGAWFLHCHIQSHLLGGMSMVIQDGIDYWPTIPNEYLHYSS